MLNDLEAYERDYARLLLRIDTDLGEMCDNIPKFPMERCEKMMRVAEILAGTCIEPTISLTLSNSEYFRKYFPGSSERVQKIFKMAAVQECNSFGIYDFPIATKERNSIGLALFDSIVYFNHSCKPNGICALMQLVIFNRAGK